MSSLAGAPFVLNGKPAYLRCGELQYFRVRRALWRPALRQLRAANFNAVATYVPWILHEPEEGQFDFDGRAGDYTNLSDFLEACREVELPVMIRPGPQIYAEFDGFGIPRWLGRDYPECVMRGPRGALVKGSFYYYYSLLHPTYLGKVEAWYRQIVAFLWPRFGDMALSFQLDNETGMPLGNTLGNFDFNPDTVRRWRDFLRERYAGDIMKLRATWANGAVTFEHALPPKRPTPLPQATDWYSFLEGYVATYLTSLHDMATRLGVSVPLVINDLDIYLSPVAPGQKRGIAPVQGYDIYTKGSGHPSTADFPFAPAHDPERFHALIGPDATFISVEMGSGWFDPRARVKPEATVQATLGGVAHGTQGHSYYIAHDGRDPKGSPYTFHSFFGEQGTPTARLKAVASIHDFLAAHETSLLESAPCYSDALYLTYQPYARLMPGDYLPGQFLPDPLLYLESLGLMGCYDLLLTAGYLPRFTDLQRVTDDELAAARVVCFPTRGWVDAVSLVKLTRYVEHGGQLITFPTVVSRDEYGRTLDAARALYPQAAASRRHIGYGTVARRLATDLLGKYLLWERWRLRRREPTAMQNTDSFEGLKVLLNQKLPAARLTSAEGMPVRGDYTLTTFEPEKKEQGAQMDPLRAGSRRASYSTHHGAGTSTVLGTVLGGAYTTGVYYQLAADERAELRRYAIGLMEAHGVKPAWVSDLDIECVARRHPSGSLLLFVFNRLGEQRGTLALTSLCGQYTAMRTLWTYSGSSAILHDNTTLSLTLKPDDVLVLQLDGASATLS
ncbi:MAG: Beta-galactosidase [Ktedonobacterales bacterium]|nr:MAG: Beta-galactosidase [Ktedonobacterales bacterium]